MGPERPTTIDRHVGARILALRKVRDLTLAELAAVLDITNRQLQKYENGTSRIGASHLFAVARFFDARVGFFFSGMPMAAPEQ